jgi:phosphoribosylanthranilate isomerase
MTAEAKICGIKTREALTAALDGGADYVGFVFFAPSPRHLDIATARSLADEARGKARIVALTVDADDVALDEIASAIAPDFFQLHGSETAERVADVKAKFGRKIIKAIPVRTLEDAALAKTYTKVADLILFDAKAPTGATRPGGHGRTFDWSVLAVIPREIPFMLSGGLTPDNVEEAMRATRPQAVDVSSGVETSPGVKDVELIRRFLHAVKTAKQG